MRKIMLLFLMCIYFSIPVYASEKFEQVEPDKECQLAAGRIWLARDTKSMERLDIANNVIFLWGYFPDENRKAIQEIAPNCEIVFLERNFRSNAGGIAKNYNFTADSKLVESHGILFEMEHAPYMENGKLMMPLRDFCNLYNAATKRNIKIEWLGDAEQNIKLDVTVWEGGILSVTKNTFSKYNENETRINGKIEMKDGVVFVPLDLENLKTIFWINYCDWNAQTNTLTLSL